MPSVIGWFYILQALPLCSWSSLFRDEAEVNVNHHFLHCWESLLAQTSLPGSLGIVPQLEEQELSPSETRALGGVLSADTQGSTCQGHSQFHSQRMDTPEAGNGFHVGFLGAEDFFCPF